MNRQSQCQQILKFIRRHGSITSWQAFMQLNCTRLSGRIFDLRQRGCSIKSERVVRKGKHYSRYSLA